MSMMFFADEAEVPLPPREVRLTEIQAHPAPDRQRVALLITLTPFLEYPNLEIVLFRPDGAEERSLTVVGTMERRLALTLHIKQPMPGEYRAQVDLIHEGEILQTQHITFSLPEPIG
jgi:hypothetical protein